MTERVLDGLRAHARGLLGLGVAVLVIAGLTAPAWAASSHPASAASAATARPRDTTVTGTDGTVTVTPTPVTVTVGTTTTVTDTTTTTAPIITLPGTSITKTLTNTVTVNTTTPGTTVTTGGSGTTITQAGATTTVNGTTTTVNGTGTTTAAPVPHHKAGVSGYVSSLMSWTFAYTPRYTKVSSLVASGLNRHLYISVNCTGHGCPFTHRSVAVKPACLTSHGVKRCEMPKTINLTHDFGAHQLHAMAQVTVTLTHRGWVGKYYRFTMRRSHQPAIRESCLAPGSSDPGVRCR